MGMNDSEACFPGYTRRLLKWEEQIRLSIYFDFLHIYLQSG
jgi:hypothetical protein